MTQPSEANAGLCRIRTSKTAIARRCRRIVRTRGCLLASVNEIGKREQRQNRQKTQKAEERFSRSGAKSSPKERPCPRIALTAAREGNDQQYCNNDPTIPIKVQNQVATDSELWHNCLARGKYASEHPVTSSLLETGPVVQTLGFVVSTLLLFSFGALGSHRFSPVRILFTAPCG